MQPFHVVSYRPQLNGVIADDKSSTCLVNAEQQLSSHVSKARHATCPTAVGVQGLRDERSIFRGLTGLLHGLSLFVFALGGLASLFEGCALLGRRQVYSSTARLRRGARRAFPFGYVPSPRVRTPPPQWSAPCLPVSPSPQASQSFLGRSYKVFLLAPARGELTRRCPSAAINPAPTAAPIPATTSQFVSSPALWRPSRVL